MLTRSVVVPVYRNEATLPELLRQLSELYERSSDAFEMVFVVDGSPDNSYAVLKLHLSQMPFPSQLISLSRNFGSFAAIRAGMTHANGEFVAVLAADLQQPVSSVSQFFSALERGADIDLLIDHTLAGLNKSEGTRKRIGEAARQRLRSYSWPGNVRELTNFMHRAFILADDELDPDMLPARVADRPAGDVGAEDGQGSTLRLRIGTSIADADRRLILATL